VFKKGLVERKSRWKLNIYLKGFPVQRFLRYPEGRNDTMTKVQQVSRESNMIKVIYIYIFIYEKGVPGCAWPEGFLVYNSKQNYQARPDEV
jgi:hypothetical protein